MNKLFPQVKIINDPAKEHNHLLPTRAEANLHKLFKSYHKKRIFEKKRNPEQNKIKYVLFRRPFPHISLWIENEILDPDFFPVIYDKWESVRKDYRRLCMLHYAACKQHQPAGTTIHLLEKIL